jgi:hypothetical protein
MRILAMRATSPIAPLTGATADQDRKKIFRAHGKILEAIRAGDRAAADSRSRQHLFDLYGALVTPADKARLESLLGSPEEGPLTSGLSKIEEAWLRHQTTPAAGPVHWPFEASVDVIAPSKAWGRRMRCKKHSEIFRRSPAGELQSSSV